MTWYVWHDLHSQKCGSHVQYVIVVSTADVFMVSKFSLQSQFDPLRLFAWAGAVSK